MGFRSGEYGGRNKNHAPRSRNIFAARGLLWLDKLSRMTTSPFFSVGASWVSTYVSNLLRFIVPSMTQGASNLSWRKAATKVWVRQWPNGA